ncbi:MAG TPA: CBS domain-containing protein [Polyangia bacterium]|jgi:CBS domain-containing protein|nr:CBS domain-containing protein [Polyangia bacterium]
MFDFDVRGISELDEPRPNDVLGLGTVHLGAAVGDVPRGPALALAADLSVAGAIEALRRSRHRAAVVVREQRPIGIVTDHDLLALSDDDASRELFVASVMTPCREPLRATDTVGTSLRRMCAARQWHLPVVCARGLLLGSIDVADLTLWLRDRMTLLSVDAALGTSWSHND